MKDPAFQVCALTVHYGSLTALADVTVELSRQGITAIVGPSGCGKSTFLACLNRMAELVDNCRITGSVRFLGEETTRLQAPALRRRVGLIFQKPNPFPISIRQNVQLALKEHGVRSRSEREAIMTQVLEDVGLLGEVEGRLDAPAASLSGGQQQRLCIARAIALQPEVLLMDEPCSALDPIAADRVEGLIRRLAERYTVVMVTHNLSQARRLADEVGVFWWRDGAGTLIEHGEVEQIFEHPVEADTAAYVSGRRG